MIDVALVVFTLSNPHCVCHCLSCCHAADEGEGSLVRSAGAGADINTTISPSKGEGVPELFPSHRQQQQQPGSAVKPIHRSVQASAAAARKSARDRPLAPERPEDGYVVIPSSGQKR